MAGKTHLCLMRIISHTPDMSRVLVMCSKSPCAQTKVWSKGKVKVAERKYRPETDEEWKNRWSNLVHLCC